MIRLKQVNGEEIVVNAELIETMEKAHDTIITLTTTRRIRVQEGIEEIIDKVIDYKRRTYASRPFSSGDQPTTR
jgi:flagellar protein FlbD